MLLSPDERQRADRYRFEAPRRRFIAGRAALRRILADCLQIDPRELTFTYEGEGKPVLEPGVHQSPYFNLSHSGELALAAVTFAGAVGIDVEQVRAKENIAALAKRFFAPSETAALLALPIDQQLRAFYRTWTRKEAYLKGRGAGLSLSLADFAVTVETSARPALLFDLARPDAPREWKLMSLELGTDFVGTLAIRHPEPTITIRDWSALL